MTEHSELPWTVCPRDHGTKAGIDDACGRSVVWVTNRPEEGISNHHDAEFIVRACNSHYELLEACRKCMNAIGNLRDGNSYESDPAWESAYNAIRKATGA